MTSAGFNKRVLAQTPVEWNISGIGEALLHAGYQDGCLAMRAAAVEARCMTAPQDLNLTARDHRRRLAENERQSVGDTVKLGNAGPLPDG